MITTERRERPSYPRVSPGADPWVRVILPPIPEEEQDGGESEEAAQ